MKMLSTLVFLTFMLLGPGSSSAQDPIVPTVSISAQVPDTTEPSPTIRVRPGEFLVSRELVTPHELEVHLTITGTATPNHDYAALPHTVTIPAGESTVTILVGPWDDDDVEHDETVIATLSHPPDTTTSTYYISQHAHSATVTIHDSDTPKVSVFSIEATARIAEESAHPLRRLNLVGEFTISRTGPTEHGQSVFVHYSGTATSGEDYELTPWMVNIPAGESSTTIPVRAIYDQVPEGIETVVATLNHCPPETFPPLGMPCFFFEIDATRSSATVLIREDGLTTATVHITSPENRAEFEPHQPIRIQATAIDIDSYISRVEFWADDTRVGVSEIYFIRAPEPGTPIHHEFEWIGAPIGRHTLTARASTSSITPIVSVPVEISVGQHIPNHRPNIAITQPAAGDVLPADEPVEIVVQTQDPDGFVGKVEFFVDSEKIGERNVHFFVAPPPNQPQNFHFTWQHPMPGTHAISARATDNLHATSDAEPVSVTVSMDDPKPFVGVIARDAFAVEPGVLTVINPATFAIRRHGPDTDDLSVSYTLHGRAINGEDYQRLNGTAVIPAGANSTLVTILPLADEIDEGLESVILRISPSDDYHSSLHSRAIAVISDHPRPHDRPHCIPLRDRMFHICFPAETGRHFRIEATTNFLDWITLFRATSIDGAVHHVDDEATSHPHRYFRITPEDR